MFVTQTIQSTTGKYCFEYGENQPKIRKWRANSAN